MKAEYLALCFLENTGKRRAGVASSTVYDTPKIKNKTDAQKKNYRGRQNKGPRRWYTLDLGIWDLRIHLLTYDYRAFGNNTFVSAMNVVGLEVGRAAWIIERDPMKSQGSLKIEDGGRWGGQRDITWERLDRLIWKTDGGAGSPGMRTKARKCICLWSLQKEPGPADAPISAPWDPHSTSDLRNCKKIDLCYLKPPHL